MLGEKITARFGADLHGRTHRALGPGLQAQHRRHARGAEPRADRRAARRRRHGAGLRPGGRQRRGASSAARPQVGDRRLGAGGAEGADALAIVTEWKEFRAPISTRSRRRMKTPVIFDGRNLYDPAVVRAHGIEYFPIGGRGEGGGMSGAQARRRCAFPTPRGRACWWSAT